MSQKDELIKKWDADLYDQIVTEVDDIEFMLKIINEPKEILEVCCGSGRILVPLAKAGHHVTGFDINDYMLAKIEDKAEGLTNIMWYKNDAMTDSWGSNFDVVVLAGNIMINIEADMNYKDAQEYFIQKAYDCLIPGGYIYLDFNLFMHPEYIFGVEEEHVIFEGSDRAGNYGILKLLNGSFDTNTQISTSDRSLDIVTWNGENITKKETKVKHIPTLANVTNWLNETGFVIEQIYGNYHGDIISETTNRAIIFARKKGLL